MFKDEYRRCHRATPKSISLKRCSRAGDLGINCSFSKINYEGKTNIYIG